MAANVGSVPTLDSSHHLKAKHLDVPAAALVGTPASATAIAVQALITAAVTGLVNGAPGALNTLQELATAIGNDPTYASDLATQLAGKATPADITAAIAAKATSDTATYVHFGSTLPTLPAGQEYAWWKTDGNGLLLDLITGKAA